MKFRFQIQAIRRGSFRLKKHVVEIIEPIIIIYYIRVKILETMKKYYLLIFSFVVFGALAQNSAIETSHIAESERKSAAPLLQFAANPNTANYDVTYHKLEFTVDPSVYFISGKVTTSFIALSDISTVTFDFYKKTTDAFAISSVKKNGQALSFVHNSNHELVITLPVKQNTGTEATIEITYSGIPPANGFNAFTISTHGSPSKPVLFTLSEPYGARDWWPCKQDLNDKVNSIDVYITAPSSYVGVSNGIEPEAPVINGSKKTTHFHHSYPIPAYLIAIAVTNYSVYNQQGGLGTTSSPYFPIVNYIYPEEEFSTKSSLAVTPNILNLFERLVGDYPFRNEKYGHAQFGWGGGMEHTTVSFMGSWSRSLIAHELAHQWFGNKVTCGTWKDIWLNEGFATYIASLVIENFDGQAAFVAEKSSMISSITSTPGGGVYLTEAEATDVNRIFSSRLSYNKGAMVLNMLRFKLGDASFFEGLKNYLADNNLSYKYAITSDLQAHLETVYGSSLSEFFNDWVYNQGYPTYSINVQNVSSGQAKISVIQSTSHTSVAFFEMPLPIRLLGSGGLTHDVVVNNTVNSEEFTVAVPFVVTGIQFDPNKDLISKNNTATLETIDFNIEQSIQLYPNPASDLLHIEMPDDFTLEKVRIYNALGQLILQSNTADFSVTRLSSGVHFVEIETSERTFHKKLIKK